MLNFFGIAQCLITDAPFSSSDDSEHERKFLL
jgi:hypothetical protein